MLNRCLTRQFLMIAALALLTGSAVSADGPAGPKITDVTSWSLVVHPQTIPSERYAASEFQRLWEKATQQKLVIDERVPSLENRIYIGFSETMAKSAAGFSTDGMGDEEFRIVIKPDAIAIAGGKPRGALYGVYTFLEDYLGVRFLTVDHTHVPALQPEQRLPLADRKYAPPIAWRYTYYGEINQNHAFAARLRQNAVAKDDKLGGRSNMRLINHSFSGQLPWREYHEEHPEYFCERNGKRIQHVPENRHPVYVVQPCLTNSDVLRIVTDKVMQQLEKHPEWKSISVSQNDNGNYCQCAACAAIDAREESHMGSLLAFVNAVAAEVEKKYPDTLVGTLAYQYSRKPPKTLRPRKNVMIQLCSIECCQIHAINDPDCPRNVAFCRDFEVWGKMTENINVWNYNVNFRNYLLPCPNLRNLEANVWFFVDNNAKGIFMQCAGNAQGAEFSDLRNYIICNLLWDPTRRGSVLMDEFLDLHYGKSAKWIKRFITLIHDAAERSGKHHHCFAQAADYGFDAALAATGMRYFEKAMNVAETEEIRLRVEKLSIAAYRMKVEPLVEAFLGKRMLSPALVRQIRPDAITMFDLCKKHEVTMVAEGLTVDEAYDKAKVLLKLGGKTEE